MKSIMSFFSILFLTYIPMISFADTNKCNKANGIHCVYYEGDKSKKNGKYVKISQNSISHIHCARGDFFDFIPQQSIIDFSKEKQVTTYEQCINAACKKTKKLGRDTFTVAKNDKGFVSYPRSFNVRLLSNYGESCTTWK